MIRLAVLGDPIAHSKSPAMHQAALDALGIEGVYEARRVGTAGMEEQADLVRSGELDGANITMPHKEKAFLLCDGVSDPASQAESVNTWCREGHSLIGHSTDIVGIRQCWDEVGFEDHPVLILGSGGVSRAAVVALGDRQLMISSRPEDADFTLLERCGVNGTWIPWGEAVEHAVIFNCTPLGMRGEHLPAGLMESAEGLIDMVYGPEPTPAVRAALEMQIPVIDGIDLLVAQAEASFRLWTGVEPPPGVMAAAARKASSG